MVCCDGCIHIGGVNKLVQTFWTALKFFFSKNLKEVHALDLIILFLGIYSVVLVKISNKGTHTQRFLLQYFRKIFFTENVIPI